MSVCRRKILDEFAEVGRRIQDVRPDVIVATDPRAPEPVTASGIPCEGASMRRAASGKGLLASRCGYTPRTAKRR